MQAQVICAVVQQMLPLAVDPHEAQSPLIVEPNQGLKVVFSTFLKTFGPENKTAR